MKSILLHLGACAAFCASLHAAPLQRVAYDDAGHAGQQPHLIDGESWKFADGGGATPAQLTCAFGECVRFAYKGLQQGAVYQARLTFFADQKRTMRVMAGSMILGEATAENGKVTTQVFDIPAAAIARDEVLLTIEKTSGPNAVVSEVEILSENPAALGAVEPDKITLPGAFTIDQVQPLRPIPIAVDGVKSPTLDLAGIWKFNPAPDLSRIAEFKSQAARWADIKVPGEWAMQGFGVKPGAAAAYNRDFTVPADWSGKNILLRCDGVYSDSTIYLNGKPVGKHSGGFTPFDVDLTESVLPGENHLVITALNESVADKLASGSQYACHPLGGIPRGIRLYALPQSHLTGLRVITRFDNAWKDATLDLETTVAGGPAELLVSLQRDKLDPFGPTDIKVPAGTASIPVKAPAKWDPEHPNLYLLTIKVVAGGKTVQTITRHIGFRQIEVRGNALFVNNQPVKLRGSNHHEVYPTTGRSVPAGIHRRDIELFREGNVNLLRTCHYPPDEALMEAADELGMFIECEAPFCWAPGAGHEELVCMQTAEMVLAYRNHPSVLIWSLANESKWGPHWQASSRIVRKLDPSRPQIFNDNGSSGDPRFTNLMNKHYPGHNGPAAARNGLAQPLYLGEDSHLNAYNRLELATDPALRDLWGKYLRELWDDIYQSKGALGQSIWSGVDDTFYMNDDHTVGYGTWGPIDGWRRQKPEWWNMKKAYSPVRVGTPKIEGGTILVPIENRFHFTDLAEIKVLWKSGGKSGTLKPGSIAPGASGILTIPATAGETLDLTIMDPRGFTADAFLIRLAPPNPTPVPGGPVTWTIDEKSGQLTKLGGIAITGPRLMLLPLNSAGETQMTGKTKVWEPFTAPCTGWTTAMIENDAASGAVTVTGNYDGAKGSYVFQANEGCLAIHYHFEITKAVNPRQVGLVFTLPAEYDSLAWQREGYWNVYPDDHIARLSGSVNAGDGFPATSVGPRVKPDHPWRLDNLPYGNNDFCSTKHNIITGSLANKSGRGITIAGGGTQHLRAWKDSTSVHFLVADYSNGGSERFLRGLAGKDDRPLKPGDKISGTIKLRAKE